MIQLQGYMIANIQVYDNIFLIYVYNIYLRISSVNLYLGYPHWYPCYSHILITMGTRVATSAQGTSLTYQNNEFITNLLLMNV